MILVIYAHPYPAHSRACAALVAAIRDAQGVQVRSLYDLYPDFDIDGEAERAALESAQLIVWLHPFYWYGVPALLKHWLDVVLIKGWSHGRDGHALEGRDCLWVTTTGGDENAFSAEGRHGHPFEAFEPPMRQTAKYCGMNWLAPMPVRGAHEVPVETLEAAGRVLRERLDAWRAKKALSNA
jgi:glutathione-regulated potassium-efflux system ancillary protein KefF